MSPIIPVVIPAYEPDDSFVDFISNLLANINQKIIVIDDGSGNQYREIFRKIELFENVTLIRHAKNLGKGRSLKDAFNSALCLYPNLLGVVTADSDGQHTVFDISRVICALEKNRECLILGSRVFNGENIPWKSRIGNSITSVVFRYICGIKISDTQTGLRGIPRSLLFKSLSISGERFDYETNVLLFANEHYQFVEVPIETVYDSKKNHKTHFDPFLDSLRIYRIIVSYSLSSLLSVIIDFSLFTLLIGKGANIWSATAVGRIGSTITNFLINRKVVFRAEGNVFNQLLCYLLLVFISGSMSATMVKYLSVFFMNKLTVCKALVEGVLFFFNYYIQRRYVFSKKFWNGLQK